MTTAIPNPTGNQEPVAEPITSPVAPQEPQGTPPTNREQIYQRYYGAPQEEPQAPVEALPTTPAASSTESPAIETPPTEPTTAQLIAVVQALQQEVTNLRSGQAPSPQPPAATPAPPSAPVHGWVDAIREGDFAKAERLMRDAVESEISPKLQQQTVQQALEMYRIENDMTTFINDIRSKNTDLLPMESFITSRVSDQIRDLKASGQIKDAVAYAETFKRLLTEEVENARKVVQSIRAAGKTDAMQVKTEVLSASTVAANPSEQLRAAVTKETTPVPETTADYIARRRQQLNTGRNLLP